MLGGRPLGRGHLYRLLSNPVLCQNSADVVCPGITGAEEPLYLNRSGIVGGSTA